MKKPIVKGFKLWEQGEYWENDAELSPEEESEIISKYIEENKSELEQKAGVTVEDAYGSIHNLAEEAFEIFDNSSISGSEDGDPYAFPQDHIETYVIFALAKARFLEDTLGKKYKIDVDGWLEFWNNEHNRRRYNQLKEIFDKADEDGEFTRGVNLNGPTSFYMTLSNGETMYIRKEYVPELSEKYDSVFKDIKFPDYISDIS